MDSKQAEVISSLPPKDDDEKEKAESEKDQVNQPEAASVQGEDGKSEAAASDYGSLFESGDESDFSGFYTDSQEDQPVSVPKKPRLCPEEIIHSDVEESEEEESEERDAEVKVVGYEDGDDGDGDDESRGPSGSGEGSCIN